MNDCVKTDSAQDLDQDQKKRGLKKCLKITAWVLGGILAFVLVLMLAHPLWIGWSTEKIVSSIAPGYTGTDVRLAGVGVNMYSGHVQIGRTEVGNVPGVKSDVSGVSAPMAFAVDSLKVDLDTMSLFSTNIHVSRVEIVNPYASCFNVNGTNNFLLIAENVEKKLGPKKEKKDEKPSMVTLDELLVTGVHAWLGTDFTIESVSVNLKVGEIRVKAVNLKNPSGASAEDAVSIASISIDLDPATIYTKRIHIKKILIDSPFVSYGNADVGGKSMNNFDYVLAHVAPPKTDEEKKAAAEKEKAEKAAGKKDDGVKVVIDEFAIKGFSVKLWMMPTVKVPFDIVLHDIGKEKDGATVDEVGDSVLKECQEAITKAGGKLGELGKLGLEKAGELGGAAVDKTKKLVGDILSSDSGKTVSEGATKAMDSVGEGAKKLVESDAAKKLSEGASKAKDAVGEGAKKVGETLKGLNPFGK